MMLSWDNSIGIADIISIVALLATFLTVVLILIQRHDSARPFVSIKVNNTSKQSLISNNSNSITLEIEKEAVTICCLGNCMAKNVKIETYFLLDKPTGFYKNISIKGGIGTLKRNEKVATIFMLYPTISCFEVINNNETVNLTSELKGKLLGMALCGFDAVSQHNEKEIPVSTPAILFRVVFTDILNKSYTNHFLLSSMFSSFSDNEYSFSLNNEIISKKQFKEYIKIYKEQNCCGWFKGDYIPSYKRKTK